MPDWSSVSEWLKRPFFPFAATLILLTLLLSSGPLEWLGLGEFRWYVAVAFLFCCGVLLSQALAASWSAVGQWWRKRAIVNGHRKRLDQLTDDEKFVLKPYIDGQTRTQYLDINDGVVAELESAGIVRRMSAVSVGMFRFPYNIADFAWDYLNKNPGKLTDV